MLSFFLKFMLILNLITIGVSAILWSMGLVGIDSCLYAMLLVNLIGLVTAIVIPLLVDGR